MNDSFLSRFVEIRTNIRFGTCPQKSFCNSEIFLADSDVQWGIAIAVSAGDKHNSFTHFGWEKNV